MKFYFVADVLKEIAGEIASRSGLDPAQKDYCKKRIDKVRVLIQDNLVLPEVKLRGLFDRLNPYINYDTYDLPDDYPLKIAIWANGLAPTINSVELEDVELARLIGHSWEEVWKLEREWLNEHRGKVFILGARPVVYMRVIGENQVLIIQYINTSVFKV